MLNPDVHALISSVVPSRPRCIPGEIQVGPDLVPTKYSELGLDSGLHLPRSVAVAIKTNFEVDHSLYKSQYNCTIKTAKEDKYVKYVLECA